MDFSGASGPGFPASPMCAVRPPAGRAPSRSRATTIITAVGHTTHRYRELMLALIETRERKRERERERERESSVGRESVCASPTPVFVQRGKIGGVEGPSVEGKRGPGSSRPDSLAVETIRNAHVGAVCLLHSLHVYIHCCARSVTVLAPLLGCAVIRAT